MATHDKESCCKSKDRYKKIVFIIALMLSFLLGAIGIFIITNVNLKREAVQIMKDYEERIEIVQKEKSTILETALYIKDYAGGYYIKDGEKFEEFMLNSTRIILEEMEKYQTPKADRMDKETIKKYLEVTYTGCEMVGIDPYISLFIAVIESVGFNIHAKSNMGALGTEQFMTFTAKMLANSVSPWEYLQTNNYSIEMLYDPIESKKLGIRYMKLLLEEFDGRVEWALVGYNAGPYRADEYFKNGEGIFSEDVPEKYRDYSDKVLANYSRVNK